MNSCRVELRPFYVGLCRDRQTGEVRNPRPGLDTSPPDLYQRQLECQTGTKY
jgi:hypothetical protein